MVVKVNEQASVPVIAVLVIKKVSINWLPKALNIVGIQSQSNLQMLHGT